MLLKVLKLAIVDYWWNGYRILPKRMRAMNRNPVKWFCFTWRILRKKNG